MTILYELGFVLLQGAYVFFVFFLSLFVFFAKRFSLAQTRATIRSVLDSLAGDVLCRFIEI